MAGFIAGIGASALNAIGNIASARMMNRWNEKMSNTAMQRRVKDLEKAGLNVGLAYGSGGASSPGSASFDLGNAIGSGVGYATARAQIANLREQNANIKADTFLKAEQLRALRLGQLSKKIGTDKAEEVMELAEDTISSGKQLYEDTKEFYDKMKKPLRKNYMSMAKGFYDYVRRGIRK